MKRYKLLKDLPTFNAGDEFTIGDDECLWLSHHSASDGHWRPQVMAYHKNTLERFPNILEDWFEEVEPKDHYYIDPVGNIVHDYDAGVTPELLEQEKQIGNIHENPELLEGEE